MDETSVRFSQADFDLFGELSGDLNPIHVDPDFSAETRFGRTVAHGMMLFAAFGAAIARRDGGAPVVTGQELVFPAPTFAGVDHVLRLAETLEGRVAGELADPNGAVTAQSVTYVRGGPARQTGSADTAAQMRGLRVGQHASVVRRFSADQTERLMTLVDDPNPLHRGADATLPPALLGGLVSYLLGMELPGRGTNWLKQRYWFARPVSAGATVTATVTVTRLRPDKDLVNLASRCVAGSDVAMTGESLVLVRDLEHG